MQRFILFSQVLYEIYFSDINENQKYKDQNEDNDLLEEEKNSEKEKVSNRRLEDKTDTKNIETTDLHENEYIEKDNDKGIELIIYFFF